MNQYFRFYIILQSKKIKDLELFNVWLTLTMRTKITTTHKQTRYMEQTLLL